MRLSLAMSTRTRTAATMSAGVLLRCPLRLRGRRNSVWTPRVDRERAPDRLEIAGHRVQGDRTSRLLRRHIVRRDLRLDFGKARERLVPACFEFSRHQPVGGIGGVILAERPICRISRRFEIAQQGVADLVAHARDFGFGGGRGGDRGGLHHARQGFLNGGVNAQALKGDAARLARIEQTAMAGVTGNAMLGAGIAQRQLAAATPAANEASEQRVAVLRRAMMFAVGDVVADHVPDRLRAFPRDLAFMDAGHQRQPFLASVVSRSPPGARLDRTRCRA